MRFTEQKELRQHYYADDNKQETKFLWLPLTIDGETRWLETATIKYRVNFESNIIFSGREYYWKPYAFKNK